MKVLIADYDAVTRHSLKESVTNLGYEVVATRNGEEAV